MEHTPELAKALKELERIAGISLDIQTDSPEDAARSVEQIRRLCTAYKEKYNKTYFLQTLMTQTSAVSDLAEQAKRLHIPADTSRILYHLAARRPLSDAAMEVLRNLFPSQSGIYLVPMTDNTLTVLYPTDTDETEESLEQMAHTIVDTLNTEALIHVQVAYSSVLSGLSELSKAYRETSLALNVGRIFYTGQTVFPYNRLGIGRLIYQLPTSLCEQFLQEIFGTDIPESFKNDAFLSAVQFLQNNLNIAETARQLHMHRNTLIYRLEQIEKQTGLDLRQFDDAMTFQIAMMVIRYLQTERNSEL